MSVGIIAKIEARLLPDGQFSEIDFTGFSGSIHKTITKPNGNVLHETTVSLKIPHISPEITSLLDGLLYRKSQFRILDGNSKTHIIGDTNYPSRLNYNHTLAGSPGSWNGYTVTIIHLSPESYPIT